MAEALLRRRLADRGVDVTVSSAGVHEGGARATDHGIAVMAERGLDLAGHVSRQVTLEMVTRADLVIGMAREHVREASVLHRGALTKTFTLKELVRLAEVVGPRAEGEELSAWLGRVGATRHREDLIGIGHDDELDVEDPVGRGRADYEATAELLDELLAHVVELAFPARQLARRSVEPNR